MATHMMHDSVKLTLLSLYWIRVQHRQLEGMKVVDLDMASLFQEQRTSLDLAIVINRSAEST